MPPIIYPELGKTIENLMNKSLNSRVARLRGRSPYFLLWKLGEMLSRQMRRIPYRYENRIVSRQQIIKRFGKMCGVVPYMRNRNTIKFFSGVEDFNGVFDFLTKQEKNFKENVITRAEKICNHTVYILAKGDTYLGPTVDWNKDYSSGYRWEPGYVYDIDLLDRKRTSDIRITWDLNRLYFLLDLGMAYRITADDRYVHKFKDYFNSWMVANPVAYTINWAYSMEIAIRVINLIWAFELCLSSEVIDEDFATEFLHSLIIHGRYIIRNLEYNDLPSNHYIANLAGLAYLGLYLNEYPEAKKWLKYAINGLEIEMQRQVYSDGVDYEKSLPYHRLVTEMFLNLVILFQRNNIFLTPLFMKRLERMLEFIQAYLLPNGSCPLIGDNDDSRICKLGSQLINDHRYLLSTGAVLFRRPDFKRSAGRFWEESAWLLGSYGIGGFIALGETVPENNNSQSSLFPNGGFGVMRSPTEHLVVDFGDSGRHGRGGHGHNDVLSFTLSLSGESLLVDTGSSKYTANLNDRLWTIGTRAHNTLMVDDMEMAELSQLGISGVLNTSARLVEWSSNLSQDRFIGEHYGYHCIPGGVTHRREIKYDKSNCRFNIIDSLYGKGQHKVEIFWHFDPKIEVCVDRNSYFCESSITHHKYVVAVGFKTKLRLERQPVYESYGASSDAWTGITSGFFEFPASINHEIYVLNS